MNIDRGDPKSEYKQKQINLIRYRIDNTATQGKQKTLIQVTFEV